MSVTGVLLIISWDDCINCKNYFQKGHAKLLKYIESDPRLDYALMKIGTTGLVSKTPLHPEIQDQNKWGSWYPRFVLVTAKSWNNHKKPLEGVVMGGMIVGEAPMVPTPEFTTDPDLIYRWVVKNMLTSKFQQNTPTLPVKAPPDIHFRYNGNYGRGI